MPKINTFKFDNFKIDGVGLGGYFATGFADAPSTASAISFTRLDGSTDNRSFIEVSGLTFTPKIIKWTTFEFYSAFNGYKYTGGIYSLYPLAGITASNYANVIAVKGDSSDADIIYPYKMTNMYVNETGFKLLVPRADVAYEWAAWG